MSSRAMPRTNPCRHVALSHKSNPVLAALLVFVLVPGIVYTQPAIAQQSFDFSLSTTGGITVVPGGSGSTTVAVTLLGGSSELVSLSCPEPFEPVLPDWSCSFDPASGHPTFSSILTVSVSPAASMGSYTLSLKGSGGGLQRTTTVVLTVTSQDFLTVNTDKSYYFPSDIVHISGEAVTPSTTWTYTRAGAGQGLKVEIRIFDPSGALIHAGNSSRDAAGYKQYRYDYGLEKGAAPGNYTIHARWTELFSLEGEGNFTVIRAASLSLGVVPSGAGKACGPGPRCTTGPTTFFDTATFPPSGIFSIFETYSGYEFDYWEVDGAREVCYVDGGCVDLPSAWGPYMNWHATRYFMDGNDHSIVAVFRSTGPPPQPQPAQQTSPQCAIATATYGSEMAPEVVYMRYVRDNLIGSTPTGRVLRDGWNAFYYLWSPPIAYAIADKELLRGAFRVLLVPLAVIIHVVGATFTAISWAGDFASLSAFVLAAILSISAYIVTPVFTFRAVLRWTRSRTKAGQRSRIE